MPPPEHCILHFPKHDNCPVCQQVKMTRQQRRSKENKKKGPQVQHPEPKKFGDQLTADHIILSAEEASRRGYQVTLTILDRATRWLRCYGCKSKSADSVVECFQHHNLNPNKFIRMEHQSSRKPFESSNITQTRRFHTFMKQMELLKERTEILKKVQHVH